MKKYWYFRSKKSRKPWQASVEVAGRTRGKVHVGIHFAQSMFGTELSPADARLMAAALIERADDAEKDALE